MSALTATIGRSRSSEPDVVKHRVEFDYLRAAVVVLVVLHHAVLAYVSWAELNEDNPVENVSPVVDQANWVGFDLIVGLNDTFFMPLMFLISGLFVWTSLGRKGTGQFLRDRLVRLGIPFVAGVLLLMPLAYYPAQLTVERTHGGNTSWWTFWSEMAGSGFGTAGPMWFVWVLLLFGAVAAALFTLLGRTEPDRDQPVDDSPADGRWYRTVFTRRVAFFGLVVVATTVTYLPLAIIFDPLDWFGVGPFDVQMSRLLMYLAYFLIGAAAGALGLNRGLLARGGVLSRRWWLWFVGGLIAYIGLIVLVVLDENESLAAGLLFILTCSLLVVGSLALFLRFARRSVGLLDSLAANAYGIYIVHYVFVTWLQYQLLSSNLSAVVKATLVFAGALALSWLSTAALRRIPLVAKII
ncbi:MAG: acyltransferase [Acidimicrobiia bacterium]|nr:acyltransferase [Acidimicrobiia bacterium]